MSIIKECGRTADFKAYVNQNPAIIQQWQKGGRLTWNRILIAKTDQCEAVVFSVTLPVRIYAWVRSLFLIFGNYYANTLHAKKVTFLDPSCLSKLNQKTVQVGQQVLPKPAAPARTPPVVNQPHILDLPKLLDSNPQRPIVMQALKQIVDQGAPLPALSPQQEKALIEALDPYQFTDPNSAIWKLFEKRDPNFQAIVIASLINTCANHPNICVELPHLKTAGQEAWRKAGAIGAFRADDWKYDKIIPFNLADQLVQTLDDATLSVFLNSLADSSETPSKTKETIISVCFSYLSEQKRGVFSDQAFSYVRSCAVPVRQAMPHPWTNSLKVLTPGDPRRLKWLVHLSKELLHDPKLSRKDLFPLLTPAQIEHLPWEEYQGALPLLFALYIPPKPNQVALLQDRARAMTPADQKDFEDYVGGSSLSSFKLTAFGQLYPLFSSHPLLDSLKTKLKVAFLKTDEATLRSLPKEFCIRYVKYTKASLRHQLQCELLQGMTDDEIRNALETADWDLEPLLQRPDFPYGKVLKALHKPDTVAKVLAQIPESVHQQLPWEEFEGALPLCFALRSAPDPSRMPLLRERAKLILANKESWKFFWNIYENMSSLPRLIPLLDLFRKSPQQGLPQFLERYIEDYLANADSKALLALPMEFLISHLRCVQHPDRQIELLQNMTAEEINKAYFGGWVWSDLVHMPDFPFIKVLKALKSPQHIPILLKDRFTHGEFDKNPEFYQALLAALEDEPWKMSVTLASIFDLSHLPYTMPRLRAWNKMKDDKGQERYPRCSALLASYCAVSENIQEKHKPWLDFLSSLRKHIENNNWRQALDLLQAYPEIKKFYLAAISGPTVEGLASYLHSRCLDNEMYAAALFDDQTRPSFQAAILLLGIDFRYISEIVERLLCAPDLSPKELATVTTFLTAICGIAKEEPFVEQMKKFKFSDAILQVEGASIPVHSYLLEMDPFFKQFKNNAIPPAQKEEAERHLKWLYGIFSLRDLANLKVQELLHEKGTPYPNLAPLIDRPDRSDFAIKVENREIKVHKLIVCRAQHGKLGKQIGDCLDKDTPCVITDKTYDNVLKELRSIYREKVSVRVF